MRPPSVRTLFPWSVTRTSVRYPPDRTFSNIGFSTAAAGLSATVECLPESSVCVGWVYFTSPSPATICDDPDDPNNCTTTYVGGYSWTYTFVEGLSQGSSMADLDSDGIARAETGLVVTVNIDDMNTCDITVGKEVCTMCSAADCGGGTSVSFDCTNVNNGRTSSTTECEFLDTIFYPLVELDDEITTETANTNLTDAAVPTSSANTAAMLLSSAFVVFGFGTLANLFVL